MKWIAYCLDCKKNTADDMQDRWNNRQMVEASARIHNRDYDGHKCIVGYIIAEKAS